MESTQVKTQMLEGHLRLAGYTLTEGTRIYMCPADVHAVEIADSSISRQTLTQGTWITNMRRKWSGVSFGFNDATAMAMIRTREPNSEKYRYSPIELCDCKKEVVEEVVALTTTDEADTWITLERWDASGGAVVRCLCNRLFNLTPIRNIQRCIKCTIDHRLSDWEGFKGSGHTLKDNDRFKEVLT